MAAGEDVAADLTIDELGELPGLVVLDAAASADAAGTAGTAPTSATAG